MSLFHVQEWYGIRVDEARFITNAELIGNRDQILIGSLDGNVLIVDPGKEVESRNEVSVLIEKRLPHSVLQILVGRFLPSYDENLLAILHPKFLNFYRLNSADEENYTLEKIFEHRLSHGPAYNMCLGEFSRQQFSQIYVQTLNCSLSIYEGENHLLDRQLLTAIHPGPIVYAPTAKCLYNASGGFLSCYPFHSFTSTAISQQKKLNYDWSLNLGDTAVDIAEVDIPPIQPSILVLCKRILYCVTHGGAIRFIIRLQAVATSFLIYKTTNDPVIQLCIGTATRTLLFYRDTTMIWSAQLDVVPTQMLLSSFSSTIVGMFCVLSDDCKLVVGYLGTEPSLFRMPLTETRFIDFEQRRKELEQFERVIKENATDGSGLESSSDLEINASVVLDLASMAYDTYDGVPSATINVKLTSSAQRIELVFQSEVFAHCQFFSLSPAEFSDVPITVFVREKPARDSRFRLAATTNGGKSAVFDSYMPLKLLCHEIGSQRNAQIKLSLDSTGSPLSIADLYSDFEAENQISLGLQPFGSQSVVSVFSASKNSRYRVQSDSSEFIYLVFEDLIRRLKKKQPDAELSCPVPLHLFVTAISEHVELKKRQGAESKELERISIQMRHVETVLLNKLKAGREETMTPINVLTNYSYQELLTTIDRVKVTEEQLERHKNETLKPLLNLMQLVMQLSGIKVPFDGRMLDGMDDTLAQRLVPLLGGSTNVGSTVAREIDAAELIRLLVSFCEQGGRLAGIVEESNEEELEAANEELKNLPGQELVNLESGAMGVNKDILELLEPK